MSLAADLIGGGYFLQLTPSDYASVAFTSAAEARRVRTQLDTIKLEIERGTVAAEARVSWGTKELELHGPLGEDDLQRLRQGTLFVDFYGKRGTYMKRLVVTLKPEALNAVLVWLDSKHESGALAGLGRLTRTIPASALDYAAKKLQRKMKTCGVSKTALRAGMKVELEHKDATKGGIEKTARIALTHLCERKDYYQRLKKYVEEE